MLSIRQIRAARAMLNWTQDDLAHYAAISPATVRKLETEQHMPQQNTAAKLKRAFEKHGIEFLAGEGLQYSKEIMRITVLEGHDALLRVFNDICETLAPTKGEVMLSGLHDPEWFTAEYRRELTEHIQARIKAGIQRRFLISEDDTNPLSEDAECYRCVPRWLFAQTPHYIYENKVALINWGPPQKILLIENPSIAETFRRQFNLNWDMGKRPKIIQAAKRKSGK